MLTEFKSQVASFELEPSSGGCFELTMGTELVYSKLATGEFPDEAAMVAEVASRVSG
ncbi:MAG: Rdx family protein [Pirellulaceae bacterium]|nr:Rdx family protein [Pirellulaceae bacterium]